MWSRRTTGGGGGGGARTEVEDWKVREEINWSHFMIVYYLDWRSFRESELGLQMKPEYELCEVAPAPTDS